MDEAMDSHSSSASLLDLPDALVAAILDYLSLSSRSRVLSTCRTLRGRLPDLHLLVTAATLTSIKEQDLFLLRFAFSTTNMVELDLASHCMDKFLHSLHSATNNEDESVLLPNLQTISMVSSQQVTDRGLLSLCIGADRAKNMRSIDITYCHNTTYEGTFCLRDALPNLQLIRRQPAWLDGSYETPFEHDGLHVYYADGSFEFERQVQCRGFVVSWNEWDANSTSNTTNPYFLFDKLQYANFEPPSGWPEWTRFCYRPGVSLLRLPLKQQPEVLVGQCIYGLCPPSDFPKLEHAEILVEPQTMRFFDRNGVLLSENDPEAVGRRHVLVSRMRVFPLPSLMPPKRLVEQNRAFCRDLKRYWEDQPSSLLEAEEFLHRALNR